VNGALTECGRCAGRGRGPWQPDFGICYDCGGKGAKDELVLENIAFMRRWSVTQDGTQADYRVRLWFVPISGSATREMRTVYLKLTIKGIGPGGEPLDLSFDGDDAAGRAYARFQRNDAIRKTETRNTMRDFVMAGRIR
jgi:hypothetical protein